METEEPLELVPLDLSGPKATTKIGSGMTPEMRSAMQQLLTKHQDVFAWSHEDMLRIDSEVIQHHLSVDPKAKRVR